MTDLVWFFGGLHDYLLWGYIYFYETITYELTKMTDFTIIENNDGGFMFEISVHTDKDGKLSEQKGKHIVTDGKDAAILYFNNGNTVSLNNIPEDVAARLKIQKSVLIIEKDGSDIVIGYNVPLRYLEILPKH